MYLNNEKKIVYVSQKKAKKEEQDQKRILMMNQSQISKYNAKYYLEEITGIYEQLTPLLFHFTKKPAKFLQIPSLNLKLQILTVLNSRNLCKQTIL